MDFLKIWCFKSNQYTVPCQNLTFVQLILRISYNGGGTYCEISSLIIKALLPLIKITSNDREVNFVFLNITSSNSFFKPTFF